MVLKVAVTGACRSGKDTVSEFFMKEGYRTKKLYFAEGIEEVIRKYFPEALKEGKKPRKLYQDIGEFFRTIDPDVWVKYVALKYKLWTISVNPDFVCTDLRQMNEYEWLKKNGFTVIKVVADPEVRIQRMKASGDVFNMQDLLHPVENQIDSLPYDYLVENNGSLKELYDQLESILSDLEGVK